MNALHSRRSHGTARARLLAIIIAAIAGTLAPADVNHWYSMYECPVAPGSDSTHPDVNDGTYWVVDLMVDISAEDDWTSTQAEITLETCPEGGTFFDHDLGEDYPPNPEMFGMFPALEYDSFYTTPDSFPNPGGGGGPGFADIHNETCYKRAAWFDTSNTGDGTFVIARYTLHDESGEGCCVHLWGATALMNTGSELHYWNFWFPFPPPTVHVVYPGGGGCYPTIQDAVNAASDGEIVQLADGTFTGVGNRDVDFQGKAITVRSASGDPSACIIDCENQSTGFKFVHDEGPTSRLEGVTITNGRAGGSYGGAVRCGAHGWQPFFPIRHGSPTISNCRFINNAADNGGAIGCVENSEPVLINCFFSGNAAMEITTGSGGALYSEACAPSLANCTFVSNTAKGSGGAIWCTGLLDLDHCTFIDNWTTFGFGGAITAGGGGVTTSPAYTFDYCTFSGNVSMLRGGGIYLHDDYCWAEITNCTFYANSAVSSGGGIFCGNGSTADVLRTIIAFSTAGQAIDCIPNGHATLTCCDVFGNAGGDWVGCIAGQETLRNNFWANPDFCDADNDDLSLRSGSPCTPGNSPCGQLVGAWPEGCELSGACCVAGDCVATNTEAECDALGGDWYEGEDCGSFECPADPDNYVAWQNLTGVDESDAQWGDFDGDGDLDLVICGETSDSTLVTRTYENQGGLLVVRQDLTGIRNSGSGCLAWGDYDGDGDLDLAMAGYEDPNRIARVYENDGSGNLTWDTAQVLTGVTGASVAWGDYDSDGDLDLVVIGHDGSECLSTVYRNDPLGLLTPDLSQSLTGVSSGSADWGDYDGDGDLDLLLVGSDGVAARTIFYENDPVGTLTDDGDHGLPGGGWSSDAAWGDYDADGDLDLAIAGDHHARIYESDGVGNFTQVADVMDIYRSSCAWGDYDNDGDLDIGFCGYSGSSHFTRIFQNTGSGFVSAFSLETVCEGSLSFADVDGDGDLDFFLTGGRWGTSWYARLYEKIGGVANSAPSAPDVLDCEPDYARCGIHLTWDGAADAETDPNGLYYCLRVGTSPGDDDVVSDTYGTPLMGNVGQATDLVLHVPPGTYYWSVRAIDSGFRASSPSAEQMCEFPGMLGDMNCDCSVDFGDINPFVNALTDPAGYAEEYPGCTIMNGDVNGDDVFDFGDINPFVDLLSGGG